MIFTLLLVKSHKVGGYRSCKVTDQKVQYVADYAKKAVPAFYSAFRKENFDLTIKRAKYQVVNGYNVQLTCRVKNELFTITLHCNPTKNLKTVLNFRPTPTDSLPIAGGWQWSKADDFIKENEAAFTKLLASSNAAPFKTILAVRSQVVAGTNYQVIYVDANDVLHSVTYYQPLNGAKAEISDIYTVQ